jgi:tRNA wybutosine-synthesizing protein 1
MGNRQEAMKKMEAAGYRFVGQNKHSAIKICSWCKQAMRLSGKCYKQQFYGIDSHRCIQMSPAVFVCSQNCLFCWRPLRFAPPSPEEKWDGPVEIVEGCIEAQKKILQGFGGNNDVPRKKKFYESMRPKHFAISLSGEPTMYPYLGDMISEIHSRKMTSFLVTNGTLPDRVQALVDSDQRPTQFYVTVAAPNKEVLQKASLPVFPDAWERLNDTLKKLDQFRRTTMRLTIARNLNLVAPEQYAALAEKYTPDFLEVKAFMSVGGARERMPYEDMPSFDEMMQFAEVIERNSSYNIIDKKSDSRVVLLTRNGSANKMIQFD